MQGTAEFEQCAQPCGCRSSNAYHGSWQRRVKRGGNAFIANANRYGMLHFACMRPAKSGRLPSDAGMGFTATGSGDYKKHGEVRQLHDLNSILSSTSNFGIS